MAQRRNSLQPEPTAPRGNKRRRTMMDSVSEVARWLLPSWASEGVTADDEDVATSSNAHLQSSQAGSSGLVNGERSIKRARHHEIARQEPMGRLSPVTPAPASVPTTQNAVDADFDDGSDSSTSGCSSLSMATPAPTANNDNKNGPRRNRSIQNAKESKTRDVSIGADQTSIVAETSVNASPSLNFSLFSRPSRALSSTMNNSLPLAAGSVRSLSSSLHKPERSLNRSIFYEGKTTYGGAAAHRKLNLFSPSPYQMTAKRSKPSSNVNVPEGSSTAKRLIEALERMNTPVQNAKRIPMGRPDSISTQNIEARRKEALESITALRQNAPPSLSTCRSSVGLARIGSNVKPVTSVNEFPIEIDEADVAPSTAPDFSAITSTPRSVSSREIIQDNDRGGAGGKIKTTRSFNAASQQRGGRKNTAEEEVTAPSSPELHAAPLPVKSLPTFSFAPKPPVAASSQDLQKTASARSPLTSLTDFSNKPLSFDSKPPSSTVCANDTLDTFTFAAPVDLGKPTKTINCKDEFSFSDPLFLKKDPLNNSKQGVNTITAPTLFVGNSTVNLKMKVPDSSKQAVPELLTGSVMDILGKDTRNDDVAASSTISEAKKTENASSAPTPTVNNSWGNQFKPAAGNWECDTCCVSNKADSSKCIACDTPKPVPVSDKTKPQAPVANQWGDMFKKPAGQWSCSVCMVDNRAETSKCISCETPKPGATPAVVNNTPTSVVLAPLNSMIKMTPGWNCDTCMIRNELSKSKCVACDSPKPGSTVQSSNSAPAASSFKFGIPSTAASDETNKSSNDTVKAIPFGAGSVGTDNNTAVNGFKFGIVSSNSESKAIENDKDSSKSAAPPVFSFGVPKPATESTASTSVATAPVATSSSAATSSGFSGFSFGAPVKPEGSPKSAAPTFAFGAYSAASESTAAKSFAFGSSNAQNTLASPSAATFSFGTTTTTSVAATSSAVPAATSASPMFSFGAPKSTPSSTGTSVFGAPSSTPAFGSNTTVTTATATQPSLSSNFSFATPATAKPAAPLFQFGAASSTPASTTTAAAPTTTTATAFVFGAPPAPTTSVAPAASFNFGGAAATAPTTTASSTSFSFGQSSSITTSNSSATAAFGNPGAGSAFGVPQVSANAASSAFGVTPAAPAANSTPAFGATPAPAAASPVFQFGATAPAAAPASSGFNFQNATSGPMNMFTFGNPGTTTPAATPASGAAAPFQFGAASAPATNRPAGEAFSFGNTASAAAPGAAPMFQFGGQMGATPVQPQFQFGSAPAPAANGLAYASAAENLFNASAAQGRKVKRAVRRKTRLP